ncbi:hypothetical protein CEW81_03915 [Kluyvera genomosp. 3]|uniref:PapC N-terminal domain-containing protein n=1 Tax=Kluyvera genomosp. 3 TaxID=2774055 RepID=A0A248KFZ2_9ENTR|nr:hypothetical protein CEW81_03915 [Kluyvera genomosp. 3]
MPDARAAGQHGLNVAAVDGLHALAADACVPLTEMIKEATIRLDVGQQRLYLTIPQAFMGTRRAAIFRRSCGITVSLPDC